MALILALTLTAFALTALGCSQPTSSKPAAAPNKTALTDAIAEAEWLRDGIAVSGDGSDVPAGEYYVSNDDKAALDAAITAAAAKLGGSQTEINRAVDDLRAAIDIYKNAYQEGTGAPVNKTGLNEAITYAAKLLSDTAVAERAADVPSGMNYVSPAEYAALEQAFAAARAVQNRASVTQAEITSVENALLEATAEFEDALSVREGTKDAWTFTISFNLNYSGAGTPPADIVLANVFTLEEAGELLPIPEPRDHYEFAGWHTSADGAGQPVTETTNIARNTQLFANWLLVDRIIYHLNGGGISDLTPDANGDVYAAYVRVTGLILPIPVKPGARFDGWYPDSAFAERAVTAIPAGASGDREFWARWTSIEYNLRFNGSLANEGGLPSEVYSFKRGNTAGNPRPAAGGAETYESGIGTGQSFKVDMVNSFIRLDDNREYGTAPAGTANTADSVTAFNYNQSFTIAFWVKVNSAGLNGTDIVLFSNKSLGSSYSAGSWLTGSSGGNGRKNRGLAFYIGGSGNTRSIKLNSSDGTEAVNEANGILIKDDVLDTWVHVAAVYDKAGGANGQVRYYANGVKAGESDIDLSGGMNGNFASYIGSSGGTAAEQYTRVSAFNNYTMNCNIQNFILKGGAMSDAEVLGMVSAELGPLTPPVLTTTVSTGVSGRFVYSWAPETADPGAAYHVYIKPGTSPETNPAAIATPDALVSGVANPGTYSGTAGGQYNIVVSASRGTETVYSNPMFVETGDYAGNTPVASVLTFTTGTSDGEISYSWTAGQYIAAHKLYVAIGNYTAAADVIANGWVVRTATEAEEAIGVTAVVKGNPGLVYSAVVAALDGATPVYSNVASGVAAKGTLSAETNIARLYQTVTATSTWHDAGYEAVKAVDGSLSSRWSADTGAVNTADTAAAPTADLTLTFGLPVQVDAAGLIDYNHTLKMFSVQYLAADGTWQNAYVHDGGAASIPWGATSANENQLFAMDFTTGMIQSTQIRLRLQRASASSPSIWEFRLFREGYGVNIAPLAAVSASSVHSADYAAAKAVDNDAGSRWAVKDADWAIGAPVECWLEFDYGGETKTVSAAAMRSFGARIGSFKIQYYSGGAWQDAHTYPGPAAVSGATTGGSPKVKWDFSPVSAAKFRLLITSNTPGAANAPSLWEFYLYSTP